MRRLDIGCTSYRSAPKLERTLSDIERQSVTDWRCFVIHNPSDGDENTRAVLSSFASRNPRFVPVWMDENVGYVGGVNHTLSVAETEYVAVVDNDIQIRTPGWDEKLASHLDRFHEIGWIFPNGGAYRIDRGPYDEIMWGVGFAWMLNRMAMMDTGRFDVALGHQEEADYALRLRMAGWKCAAARDVHIGHDATATNDPASIERINRGVVAWVNKWNRYFNGKNFNYHSLNVTRWEDWPPNALYLEEYWKQRLNGLNAQPEQVMLDGREYDLIKVPRLSGFYTNRII